MNPSDGSPLSPLQDALWRRARAVGREPEWIGVRARLEGPLDPAAFGTALEQIVRRHEILRTRFVELAGTPRQVVEPEGTATFEVLDLGALGGEQRERELTRKLAELRRPYRRDGAAPLQVALVRVAANEHLLLLAQSSLAADWRALWNVARELVLTVADGPEEDAPAQFADVATWLLETRAGEDAPAGRAFWERTGLRECAPLRLPLEFERTLAQAREARVTRVLAHRTAATLVRLAQARRVPVESFLLAAWQVTLARHAERDSFVLGVRASGRAFQGLDEALGPFERLLPLVAHVEARLGLGALARQSDEALSLASEWHEFFEAELLARDESLAYAFEHGARVSAFECGRLTLTLEERCGTTEPARLLLRVEERPAGWTLEFVHDPRFLSQADVEALAGTTLAWLDEAALRPDAPWGELAALDAAGRAHVLECSSGTTLPPAACLVHDWILASAAQHGARVAVRAGGEGLSYAELELRSAALAAELATLGVGPGVRVGVHLERSLELVVALLAVLRAGGAYVPLPPAYPRERVLGALSDSGAALVVGSARSALALSGFRGPIVRADEARPAVAAPTVSVGVHDLAYVIYTSGSTGKPKGVPVTHANLAHSTRARLAYYERPVERYLLLSSFAFDSSVAGIFWTLVSGGTLVLPPEGFEKELAALPDLIAAERPTHLLGLPSLWTLLLEQAQPGALDALTTVIVAGESCPPELVRRHHATRPGTQLFNEYGPTEGTVWSTVFDTAQPCERAQVPIGRPIPGTRNYVLDAARALVPPGVAGELWIGGPGVVQGYLERPELSAERFADDPFLPGGRMYRTGDRARWLTDGNLEFLGRLDQQVKIRGYRIELEEIEAVLGAHPAVREAVVAARDDGGGATLVAYVLASGPAPLETDLVRYLGERLPEHMVPARAVVLAAWPRLPNGKIDKAALPAPAVETLHEEPVGALEIVLSALFADVLGVDEVARHDDFFARGGHSLSATRLYARLKETLQARLPLRALFEHRTPAALAAALSSDPAERARVEARAAVVLSILEGEERALGA